jgi:membrane-bound lytic murein transglycosylase D
MNKFWVAVLLLLLGGCLPALPENVTREPAFPTTAAPDAVRQHPFVESSPAPEVYLAKVISAPALPSIADELLVTGEPFAGEEALEPEDEEELASDPETAEEKALLTAGDVAAPDEEGVTVAPEEVLFDFPVVVNDKVRYFVDYFSGPTQKVFRRWLERSGRYLAMMRQIFAEEGVPQDLVYLAMIESGFNEKAYSRAHAAGPWQFIAGTGRLYGLEKDWWRDERRDPVKSTRAAARHLRDLYATFGDWYLAMAAYNAGAGKVQRAIEKYDSTDFWTLSHGSYLAAETKNYVPKMLAALLIAKQPEKFGFADLEYHEPLDFEMVQVPTATDLEIIADLCAVNYEEIKGLNPELKRWCTPPSAPDYEVRIPQGSKEDFLRKYALLPEDRRVNYAYHRVSKGDTLSSLAKRYGIRTEDIASLNSIRNPRSLRVGSELILPLHSGARSLSLAQVRDEYDDLERNQRSGKGKTYQVRKGDSLWKIARRFGVSEQQLKSWNRIGSKAVLRPGQTLVVSAGKGSAGSVAAGKTTKSAVKVAATGKKTTGDARKIVYKVQRGDTLFAIARQFNVDTSDIMGWNNLRKGHVLQPGDRLTLRVPGDRRGG